MKVLSKDEIPCQVVIRTVTKKPGLKDNNFQVSFYVDNIYALLADM